MGSFTAYVSARGIKDGLLRGKKLWTVLGGVLWAIRLIARMASRKPILVAREVLQPGQSITITSVEQADSK
jgi:hypothetical protein